RIAAAGNDRALRSTMNVVVVVLHNDAPASLISPALPPARARLKRAKAADGPKAPAANKRNSRGRRYCRPRPLCCRLAHLDAQKPSKNGHSIPIFDGEARNTAHSLGGEARRDHVLQRHAYSSDDHSRTCLMKTNSLLSA